MRDELLEAVHEDPNLRPEEKETTLRLGKRDDHATVYSAEAGITRRLLAHSHVIVEGVTVSDGDARRDVAPDEYDGGAIVGVRASIPVGALQVKLRPRKSGGHADIVTDRVLETPAESEETDGDDEPIRADGGRRFPTAADVGEEIGVDPDRLRGHLKINPHASPGTILTAFGADLRYTDLVEEWLEGLEREHRRRARGGNK